MVRVHWAGIGRVERVGASKRQRDMNARRGVRVHEPIANAAGAVSREAAGLQNLGPVLISKEREDIVAVESACGTVNGEAKGGNKSRQAGAQGRTTETIWVISELAAIAQRDMKTFDSAKNRADKAK